jgi:hypothetical protein
MAGGAGTEMPGTAEQNDWIERVLGIGRGGIAGASKTNGLVNLWQSAKDSADIELVRLSDSLRKANIPVLNDLAARIETLLDQVRVRLLTSLGNLEKAPTDPKARENALAALQFANDWLASNPKLDAVEANPLRMTINARSILRGALTRIEAQLSR